MPRAPCARNRAEVADLRLPRPAPSAILAAPPFEENAVPHSAFAGAVVYAKDIVRVSRFYAQVAGLEIVHEVADHVVLESADCELVVVAIPAAIAVNIPIATPPVRRENTAVKLVLRVDDLEAARAAARGAGGELDPPAREWEFQGARVCDGHDPEGNVIQLRQETD
jgi:predicted enzyme related to lactoylglutathione lyase